MIYSLFPSTALASAFNIDGLQNVPDALTEVSLCFLFLFTK